MEKRDDQAVAAGEARCPGTSWNDIMRQDSREVPAFLTEEHYEYLGSEPISSARYFDPDFAAAERERLWPRVWQFAAREEELPEAGDFVVFENAGRSFLLVRQETGEVRAFHNVCLHRGRKLRTESGWAEEFVCPFHGFSWKPDGWLRRMPCRWDFGHLSDRKMQLPEAHVGRWGGYIFVRDADEGPSLEEFLAPLPEFFRRWKHEDCVTVAWVGKVVKANWKITMEAFMESYHVMQTHRQLFDVTPNANAHYGANFGEGPVNEGLSGKDLANTWVDFHAVLSDGMGGSMVHQTEVAVLEGLRDMDLKPGMEGAGEWYGRAWHDIEEDARKRGADMFELARVQMEQPYNAVEYMFPHFFLLPVMGSAASYRIRPLTPETCRFEIWGLVLRPEGQEYDTPSEPIVLPYNSPDFPEIPRQDYSNLPIQQLGLHNIDHMRIGKGFQGGDSEGLISNYQRVLDGFLAGLDTETLRKAQNIVNCGFDSTILDVGFGPEVRKSEPAPVAEPEPAVA